MKDQERKLRKRIKAKSGEPTLDAMERYVDAHQKLVNQYHTLKAQKQKKPWHKRITINTIARLVGLSRDTVEQDIKRELLHPNGFEVINGRRCLVFSSKELGRYRDFKNEQYKRVPRRRRNSSQEVAEFALRESKYDAAEHFGIKVRSVEKALARTGMKEEYDRKWGYSNSTCSTAEGVTHAS